MTTNTQYGYLNQPNGYLADPYLSGYTITSLGTELDVLGAGPVGVELTQNSGAVSVELSQNSNATSVEFTHFVKPVGVEFYGFSEAEQGLAIEFNESNIGEKQCTGDRGYLSQPYLSTPYLAGYYCAGLSVELNVQDIEAVGTELNALAYNTNRLRVLCDFDSRGDGQNWTSNSTKTSPTDAFNINNVNSDIVAQEYRSANGTKVGINLDCDAGVGVNVFLDTLVIFSHNMTTSASVNLIGADNPSFATAGFVEALTITENNFVYIAADAPLEGYRYWRFEINDNTNPNDNITIGVIAFGASSVMNNYCANDQIKFTPKEFKDTVFTEGYTNVMSARSLNNTLDLAFNNITYNSRDWKTLQAIFDYSRTTLKCFWIPDPQYPLRFLTFGKLREMPKQNHNYKGGEADYVSFSVTVDESL